MVFAMPLVLKIQWGLTGTARLTLYFLCSMAGISCMISTLLTIQQNKAVCYLQKQCMKYIKVPMADGLMCTMISFSIRRFFLLSMEVMERKPAQERHSIHWL